MATTQDYINQLKIDKQNLVSMLNNMGVEANNNETFTALTPKVGKIVTDPILQDKTVEITENGTTNIMADNGYNGLNNVEVITNVADSGGSGGKYAPRHVSFYGYKGTELNEEIANLDTNNITSMKYMFRGCDSIPSLDLSSWDTSNVTDMSSMFYSCKALTEIDLSSWDTSNVTNMGNMFSGCTSLQKVDMRNADFNSVTEYSSIFGGSDTTYVPRGCLVIVKDSAAKTWMINKASRLTNIKTVAEL